ncbi:hypothetical protein, partial [Burkholderia mallei]|uniref:hypothetical protein n=1 Tax=Burkholderia mallei TaxID=13373 RepID=UPI001E325888
LIDVFFSRLVVLFEWGFYWENELEFAFPSVAGSCPPRRAGICGSLSETRSCVRGRREMIGKQAGLPNLFRSFTWRRFIVGNHFLTDTL